MLVGSVLQQRLDAPGCPANSSSLNVITALFRRQLNKPSGQSEVMKKMKTLSHMWRYATYLGISIRHSKLHSSCNMGFSGPLRILPFGSCYLLWTPVGSYFVATKLVWTPSSCWYHPNSLIGRYNWISNHVTATCWSSRSTHSERDQSTLQYPYHPLPVSKQVQAG